MIITLEPNQSIEIRFAHSRDNHGKPLCSDETFTIKFDDKNILVQVSNSDEQGRTDVIYKESYRTSTPSEYVKADSPPTSTEKQQELFNMARTIISEHLAISPEMISMQSDIMHDLGADSLDLIELVMAFEVQYQLKIPDEDVDDICTVNDIIKYLKKRV